MDILEKITKLREERHWSEYQLATKSGLTQSTISSWYRKNMLPTIPSLSRICDAFGMILSQFFLEDDSQVVEVTPEQFELLQVSGKLTPQQFDHLLEFLKSL